MNSAKALKSLVKWQNIVDKDISAKWFGLDFSESTCRYAGYGLGRKAKPFMN